MSNSKKKSVAEVKASNFETMVQDLVVQPSTPVITADDGKGGKLASHVPAKKVIAEIATLDKDKAIASDTIPSLVSNWDVFQKKAVEDALKLSHRIGRVMYHVGYDKLDETVDTFKEAVKTHFAKKIAEYVEKVGDKKKWSQTPEYKNGIRPIKDGREWVFPTIKTAIQIANDKTAKAKKEKEKQAARVVSLSEGEDGQMAISACRLIVKRMISSAHSVSGLIVMTDKRQAEIESGVFQVLSNFLTAEKLAEGKTETPALGVTTHAT